MISVISRQLFSYTSNTWTVAWSPRSLEVLFNIFRFLRVIEIRTQKPMACNKLQSRWGTYEDGTQRFEESVWKDNFPLTQKSRVESTSCDFLHPPLCQVCPPFGSTELMQLILCTPTCFANWQIRTLWRLYDHCNKWPNNSLARISFCGAYNRRKMSKIYKE